MVLGGTESLTAPSDAMVVVRITSSMLYQNGPLGAMRYRPARRFDRADYQGRGLPLCILAPVLDSDVQSKCVCRSRSSYHHDGAPQCNYWGTSRKVSDVKGFARLLFRSVCVYLSLAKKEYNFDVFDSVPDDDPRFGMPNKGQHMQYMLAGGLAKDYLSNLQSVLCNDFILLM